MTAWILITDNPPHDTELLLWIKAEQGYDEPIGAIIGAYRKTDFVDGWAAKSVIGEINTGIRADLITHYAYINGPDDGRNDPTETQAL